MDCVFLRPEYRNRPEYKIRPRQGKMGTPSGSKPLCGSAGWHGPVTPDTSRQIRGLTEMVARWQAGSFLRTARRRYLCGSWVRSTGISNRLCRRGHERQDGAYLRPGSEHIAAVLECE